MTVAENIFQTLSKVPYDANTVIRFRKLCERFKLKYVYDCDALNLRFRNIYTLTDGSSIAFKTEFSNGTNYFLEVA